MRPFEILLLLAALGATVLAASGARAPRARLLVTRGAFLLGLLQLALEGMRWQLWPAHALVLGLFIVTEWRRARGRSPADGRRTGVGRLLAVGFGVVLLLFSGAAGWLLPVPAPPRPAGEHPVGTTRLVLVDSAREERFTPNPSDKRRVMVQLFYPAARAAGRRTTYLPHSRDLFRQVLAGTGLPLPAFLGGYLELGRTNSRGEAPVGATDGALPVVLFNHGYNPGSVFTHTEIAEALASRGYVVASIGHPYETSVALLESGRVITLGDAIARARAKAFNADADDIPDSLGIINDSMVPVERRRWAMLERLKYVPTVEESLEVWLADTRLVLAELDRIQQRRGQPLAGRLALDRVAVAGMSFGGHTAAHFCTREPRCAASLNLDGNPNGRPADPSLRRPAMAMLAGENRNAVRNRTFYGEAAEPYYEVVVAGTKHYDFSDGTLSQPLTRRLGLLGPIGGARAREIIHAYTVAFLDRHLRGRPVPLLDRETSPFRDVSFRVFPLEAGVR